MRTAPREQPRPKPAIERGLLLLILAFVAMATAYNLLIPPYENLDELEHAEVVRHIAVTGRLPIHDEAESAGYHVRQEASQPPLYHVLAAGFSRLLGLSAEPHRPTPVPSTMIACGETATFYNKATWVRDPYTTITGWTGAITTVHVLRAFSTLLQTFTIAGVWLLARRAYAHGPIPALAAAIVAFNPQFLLLAAGVNNDNAVIPLATWGLILGTALWKHDLRLSRTLGFAVIAGLAALSKLSGIAVLGIGGLALLIRLAQGRAPTAATVVHAMIIILVVVVMISPWLIRNNRIYGDPTALAPMLDKVGRRNSGPSLGEARLMFLSYWGQLPCSFYPRAFYWPYLILTAGGALSTLIVWRRLEQGQRFMLKMCLVWFIVIVLAWIRWGSMTSASGGRLLFPAGAALAFILATGWSLWGKLSIKILAATLPILSLSVLVLGPMTILAPPRTSSPPGDSVAGTQIEFGNRVSLQSYEADIRDMEGRCVLMSDAYCEPSLDLKLAWQAQSPITENLTMVVQLVSAAPGSTDLRLNYNYWPGRGNLPTSMWPVGSLIEDHYYLPLPPSDRETQAWRVTLAFLDPDTSGRLPVEMDSAVVGDSLTLDLVRVPGRQPDPGQVKPLPAPVVYSTDHTERALQLEGAQVTETDGGNWAVDLLWLSNRPMDVDAITFVHGYDAAGALLVGGDGPPKQGAFPTSLWQPGDRIHSRHTLSFGPDTKPDTIAVGLYLSESGTRLRASMNGEPLPNSAYVVWNSAP